MKRFVLILLYLRRYVIITSYFLYEQSETYMNKHSSLQDPFLNTLRKEKVSISIYLLNGIKLQGVVEAFDQVTIVLRSNVNQLVYKHSISTIVPSKTVRILYSNYNPNHSGITNSLSDKKEDVADLDDGESGIPIDSGEDNNSQL